MRLPDDDERYLTEKGFDWALLSDNAGACLVLRNYPIDAAKYEVTRTDVMVRIPAQYPMANLDMFYADPPVKLRGGAYPKQRKPSSSIAVVTGNDSRVTSLRPGASA